MQIFEQKKSNYLHFRLFDAGIYKKSCDESQLLSPFTNLFVIHAGFKPATPTSVVWYSIQLS